ncbi:MAG: arginine--tRNA ligase [Candidatus Omnitrophica bacterium]|nr:arginine--tRNA ligase [Candidatus Omnitrophota bacterium]
MRKNHGIEEEISRLIRDSIIQLKKEFQRLPDDVQVQLEIPKQMEHGDLFTNIAMRLAAAAGKRPADFAALLIPIIEENLNKSPLKGAVRKFEVKPPGFINLWLSDGIFYNCLEELSSAQENFGRRSIGAGKKVLAEFVSANPTGPLTIAHARQAAFGDSLANILEFCGYKVTREYYINDEGVQMSILADSVLARYLELHKKEFNFPENGYKGGYIYDIAKAMEDKYKSRFVEASDRRKQEFLHFSCDWIMGTIKKDLDDFGIRFDIWYSQAKLGKSGKIEAQIKSLRDKEFVYDSEGASWFKSTAFGDDKDRVVIKSDGSYTYLAPDIAYHKDKFARGFDKLIDIWGPDHHGYIPRLKAAIQALGFDKDSLSVIIIQLATLFREGKPVSMSTRQGEFITLRELIDEVGRDAGRFFFLMRKADSHLDFDLELAKKHSPQNPVYYVQYAHARICSILEKERAPAADERLMAMLKEKEEIDLIKFLWKFPHVIEVCGLTLEPHGLVAYLQELAGAFHGFYDRHRVINDDAELTKARLFLVDCARIILASGLKLLGVSAPNKM